MLSAVLYSPKVFMKWQVWTRPFGSYVFLLTGLGLLGLTVLLSAGAAATRDRDRWVAHTLEILQYLERYESGVLQAESRSRSLMVFSSRQHREATLAGIAEANDSVERLLELSADNPTQTARLMRLKEITAQISRTISVRLDADTVPITPLLLNPLTALPVFETINEIRRDERRLLIQRQAEQVAADTAFWRMIAFALALNIGFIWWAFNASRKYIRERNEWEFEIRLLNSRLAAQVEEIRSFSATLEDRVHEKTQELERTVEKLRSSNAELERFAYIASHDLQEPLRQVASFNNLLRAKYGSLLDDAGHGYLESSIAGAKRLQLMLRGLLKYSQISMDPINRTEFPVRPFLENIWKRLAAEVDRSSAVLEVQAQDGVQIAGDREMMETVVECLLSNAIRFRSPNLAPRILVSVSREPEQWTLSVDDNGIGVDARFARRMFEMFARDHAVGKFEGAGTGLAISKKIVESHGGAIQVTRKTEGSGTVFTMTVPVILGKDTVATNNAV